MSKALSLDLRVRVLTAVEAGATHCEDGERFWVSPASVSRRRARKREEGKPRPKALGGDRRSGLIEAHQDAVMRAFGPAQDATIEEVRNALVRQGIAFGFGDIQRFFARHDIMRKDRQPAPLSSIVPTF